MVSHLHLSRFRDGETTTQIIERVVVVQDVTGM